MAPVARGDKATCNSTVICLWGVLFMSPYRPTPYVRYSSNIASYLQLFAERSIGGVRNDAKIPYPLQTACPCLDSLSAALTRLLRTD